MEMSRENFREEVKNFRSNFKEDALSTAEKSVRLEKRGNIGLLIFDQLNERANKLSTPNLLRFYELLTDVESDKSIEALVIVSRKPTIFIAGADIAEIKKFAEIGSKRASEAIGKLQLVFSYLESLPIPTIAAIHGATMGGGCELVCACDYRIASDAPETKIALPEVLLGIIPGWGGTQRLPRLIGLEKAMDMILTGKALDAKRAKKMGLVDKVAPKEVLEEKALAWAAELAKTKKKRTSYPASADLKEKVLKTVPGAKWLVFDIAKKKVLEKTKGNYPAPLGAIDILRRTYGGDMKKGLKVEAEVFGDLIVTPECQSLISVYYLNEKVKKDKGATVPAKEVKRAGVLGAGVMGGGIAQLFAAKEIPVRMKDIQWDAVAKGYQAAYKVFKKLVDRKRLRPNELDNAMARIEGATTFAGFQHLDIVVEAVVEDLEIKKKVFKELEQQVGKGTILATNTSSLSVSQIAEGLQRPEQVAGMHFFNPVDKMPLVEVVRGKQTSEEAVATVFAMAKKTGKTPIVVKDSPGFVVNRILGPYLNEAVYLMAEGNTPSHIDEVIEKFGMPMGPCALLDEVGLDVGSKVSKVLYGAFGERMKSPQLMESITADGRYGKKVNKGIYLYDKGKRGGEDSALFTKLGIKLGSGKASDEEIRKRLIYLMINEGARVVEEGLVRDVSDVDVGMIYGTGFAPFRGGLLRYADSIGAEAVVSELDLLTRNIGPRFQPAKLLQEMAVAGKKFYT